MKNCQKNIKLQIILHQYTVKIMPLLKRVFNNISYKMDNPLFLNYGWKTIFFLLKLVDTIKI